MEEMVNGLSKFDEAQNTLCYVGYKDSTGIYIRCIRCSICCFVKCVFFKRFTILQSFSSVFFCSFRDLTKAENDTNRIHVIIFNCKRKKLEELCKIVKQLQKQIPSVFNVSSIGVATV